MQKLAILLLGLSLTAASCNLFSMDGQSGSKGVFKSEDNGESFHASNAINKKADISGVSVNVLQPDPRNNDVIFLGSPSGVYKTTDGTAVWQQILSGIGIADIAIDPSNPEMVYAAGIAGDNGKIVRSVDGGGSWNEVYTEPTKSSPVTSIAIARNNSNLILAGLSTGEIIRSVDQGQTWQVTQDLNDRVSKIRQAGGNFYAMLQKQGLAKSTNQGQNWTLLPSKNLQRPLSGPEGTKNPYASGTANIAAFYDLALEQTRGNLIYLGTDQGLLKSSNEGGTWSFVPMPVTDSNLAVTAVALTPGNSNGIIAAIGPVVFKSLNSGATWENKRLTTDQTVRTILINNQATNVMYLGLGVKK